MLDFLCKRKQGRNGVPRSPMQRGDMFCGLFLLLLCASGVWAGCTSPCPTGCICLDGVGKKDCSVNCSHTGLTRIPLQAELPTSQSNIEFLYFNDNNITSIGANDLTFMTNLQEVYLQGNNITSIHHNAFDISTLRTINLSNTQLSWLPDDLFANIKCLKTLDLSWNKLTVIQEQVFKTLTCIEDLDISHNLFVTFQTNALSSLSGLQKLNIANNPFHCNCDLMSFREELVDLETNHNLVFVDRNDVNCSNAPTVNLLDQSSEKFWFSCRPHVHNIKRRALADYIDQGPEKLGSCYYDSEEKTKHDILFSKTTPVSDNQTCVVYCFDNQLKYGIYDAGLCMCGYLHNDPSNGCWCSSKVYADGSNMACQVTVSGSTSPVVYVSGVYPISAGLTIEPFDIITAGQAKGFKAKVTLPTIVMYIWDFGDSSRTLNDTTTGLFYNVFHTYSIPGTYTLTVRACTVNGSCTSISVPVEVRPSLVADSIDVTCPSATPSLSSTVTVTGKIRAGYNAEIKWTKSPADNVTETTVGQCVDSWDFFRGRCLQQLSSPSTYAVATTTCDGGKLLTVHYPEEITEVLNKYTSLNTIYLGAQKSGNGYVWANGNQAFFMVSDVTDSGIGSCVVIDRSTGGLKGIACSEQHGILCQEAPNTECALGGQYYSTNGHCYKLYEVSENWAAAATACNAVNNQSQLAVIDSSSLESFIVANVFGSVSAPAWVGLTDRSAESYLMWTNNRSTINYDPIGTAPETDCFTLDSTGTWTPNSCQETKFYICQYSLRETIKVPSYLVGVGHLEPLGTTYSLTSKAEATAPSHAATITKMFPGLWFSHDGEVQEWNFKMNSLTKTATLVFQVYRPSCASGTLIKPGCDGNGARYASCSSTVTTCSAAPYCNEGQEVCYYTNTCIRVADPCSCTQNATSCDIPFLGSMPSYELVGQTAVEATAGSSGHFSVKANGINVKEGDIIGFQTDTSSEVVDDDYNDIDNLQNMLNVINSGWSSIGDVIDESSLINSPWRNNTAVYFQAVYTIPQTVTMPESLQYSTVAGAYTYELSLPTDNIAKTCSINVEEAVGDYTWISPAIQSSSGGVDTFFVDAGTVTDLVFSVKRGTNVQVSWTIDGTTNTSSLQSSCPGSVSTSMPTLCDISNYRISDPFGHATYSFPYNSGTPASIQVTVQNSVGSNTKSLSSIAFLPLGLTFNLTDTSHGDLVKINQATSFTTAVTSGNPTSYTYYVNGTQESTGVSLTFTHTFTNKDVYEITVQISDGYKSENASMIVYGRYVANVQNMVLVGAPSVASIGRPITFEIQCNVNSNANINVQWEFESATQSETVVTASTSLSLTKTHTHTINGTYTLRVTITDEFNVAQVQTQAIRVFDTLPSVSLSASPTQIKTGASIDFIATVPNLAIKDYGSLTYTFDFNDTFVESGSSKEKIHTFSSAGTYHVYVNVTNGAETVETTVTVEVLDEITGLAITADRIVVVNNSITITASVTTGNSLSYRFEVTGLSLASGITNDNVYKPYMDTTGHFNITVTAWNNLDSDTVTKEIYVVDTSTFEILGMTHNKYQATNTLLSVAVDILYYDPSALVLTWYFDGNLKKGGLLTQDWTFTTSGVYNISVVVQIHSTTNVIHGSSLVTVMDEVNGLTLTTNSPVPLTSSGFASVTITATVTGGDNLRYTWNQDGVVSTTTTNTLTVTKTSEGNFSVDVMVWNEVGHQNASTIYKVQREIQGLQITCLNCNTSSSGISYVRASNTASFVASLTSGSDVTYQWDFGDGSSTVDGISQSHTYTLGRIYTIALTASNDVGQDTQQFNITVQEDVTSVSINGNAIAFVNNSFTLEARPTGGAGGLWYMWQDCSTCPPNIQTSATYTTGVYYTEGTYFVTVLAYNQYTKVISSKSVRVLNYITSVTLTSDLVQGQYAAKDKAYTFSSQPNTEHSTFYNWTVHDGTSVQTTSATSSSKNLTYTFTSPVNYTVSIKAWNHLGSEHTTSITVYVQTEISSVTVTFDKPSPIGTNDELTMTAGLIGTGERYSWSIVNTTTQYQLTESTKSVKHTFPSKGDYTVVLEVSNDLGSVTVNRTITVIEAVTGVAISSVIDENYPYIATGTSVTFTSAVVTGENYATSWSLADGVSSALTFSGSSLTHQFMASGTYTLTVTVQNSVSSGTYSMTIYVEGAITSLAVIPDTTLAQTGQVVTITANYSIGADSLYFEWTVDGNIRNLTLNVINPSFNSAGSKIISVKVYNHVSAMTQQIIIVVEVPILGLSVTGCNLTEEVNKAVTAAFTVTQGTDVTFTYQLQTGSTNSVTGTGNGITHTYTSTGIYSLNVNASNKVSSLSSECQYTIIGPISNVAVDTTNSKFFVNYTVNFQVTGNNLVGVTYKWKFLPTNEIVTTTDSLMGKIFTTPGSYSYELEVSNSIGSVTISGNFVIEPLHCDIMQVTKGGLEHKIRKKSSTSTFEVTVDKNGCTDYTLSYKWRVYNDHCSSSYGNLVSLSANTISNTPKLMLDESLSVGDYCVQLSTQYDYTPLMVDVSYNLTVQHSDLVALISGGSTMKYPDSTTINVDGSTSFDPDDSTTVLTYSWACTVVYPLLESGPPATTPSGYTDACAGITSSTASSVQLNPVNILSGQTYTITLTVSAPGRTSGTFLQEIEISSNDDPVPVITCVTCASKGRYVINQGQHVAFTGSCINCASTDTLYYEWSVFSLDASSNRVQLTPITSAMSTTGTDKQNFVLLADALPSTNGNYIFKLEISKQNTLVTLQSSSEFSLKANNKPTGGTCTLVTSTAVDPLITPVQVSCTGFSDPDNAQGELNYKVMSYSKDTASLGQKVVIYFGTLSSPSFYLAPWPGTSRTAVNMKVYIMDEDGSETLALDTDVPMSSTVTGGNQIAFLQSQTTTTLPSIVSDNNPTILLQYGIAITHELNELSRQESLLNQPNSHVDDRNLLRNRITISVLFLPLETIYQQQQMAHILNMLTHYSREYQTSACQTLVLNQIDILKADLENSAFQGADKKEFTSSLLLDAVNNNMEAVNAAIYSSVNISNVTSLDTSTFTNYKPAISTLTLPTSLSSDGHKQEVITRSFQFGNEIAILNLKTLLPLEDPILINLDNIKVYGKRIYTDSIERNYSSDGCIAVLQAGMLTSLYPTRQEVFQIMMVVQQNPFTWGNVGDVPLNTKVIAAGFTDTSGQEMSVSNIPSGERPKFYIMKNGGDPYNITDSLQTSPNYSPQAGLTFSSTVIEKASVKRIIIDTSTGYDGAAMHIQIKFEVVPNAATSANATGVIKVYLGRSYEATKSSYEQMKEIKTEYMASGYDHTSYTLFVGNSDFDTDASYSVTVYNDDPNFAVNVSAAKYFSTCQFFDTSTSSWSMNGCASTEESIENYCVCECHHLTPFGGGMLAPPDSLSFADLLDLDLSTNPVVFVTCCLIFVAYVVAVIVCRRLDQSSLEKISTIPLCGKDGSFKYEVTVITGRQIGAGTTANVGMKIYGEYGKTSSKQLDKKWAFQRNGQDSFIMAHDTNLGNIDKIMIWHDNSGLDPSWYLTQVIIKDMQTDIKYYFFANFWMSLEMEKGFIQKEIKAAGSSEIQRFGRMFNRAVSNCMADRHLWYSVVDRPAMSRFTRVQRATCVVTILYTFMAINAMWYGLLKQEDNGQLSSFGWEEVVLSFVTNVIAFPITLVIIWMFKRSKSKTNIFDHGPRAGTAQTIEIDYEGPNAGSFKTNDDEFLSYLDRESTTDSLVQASMTHTHLRRSRTLKITRQATDDSLNKAVNSFDSGIGMSQEGKLKRTNNPHLWSKNDSTQKDETYITKTETSKTKTSKGSDRKEEVKEAADGILQYLDDVESECMMKEQGVIQKRRANIKRTATKKTDWKEVDDILHSDTESRGSTRSRPLRKKGSTSTLGSYGKPDSSQSFKTYSPREDPNINGHERKLPSAGSTFIWANKLRASSSMDSSKMQETNVDGIGPLQPDLGLAQQSNPELEADEMHLLEKRKESTSCTLPAYFVYVAYVISFILCVTSVVLVILYGQKFGAEVALQWILALLFCIAMSFIVIEPLKALVIAFYASSILKKEDTTEEDAIDIQPSFDTSNEKVKETKFTPLAGFALLNAREEGQKIIRMRVMLRQFIAYLFYLWLLMTLCYVNLNHDSYHFKTSVDNTIVQTTIPGTNMSFINISDVDEFWDWSQNVLVAGLHYREINTDLEFGTLLGVARLRLVRSLEEPCPLTEHSIIPGLTSLTNRTCFGNYGYKEDTSNYGEGWNQSNNLSWQYSTSSQTGSRTRYGYVYTYGGGGYTQELGITYNDSLTKLTELKSQNWIDERTRAIFIDFTMYSAANDLTTVVTLMIEFPLTGALNTSSDIQSQILLRFVQDVVDPLMVCQCILFLVNIYLVCHIGNTIREEGKGFFSDPWNWLETLTTLMAVVVNGLYIGCVVEASSTFNEYFSNRYGFTNFEAISDTHVAMRYIQGILIFLLMIKVVKQLRFIKFLYVYEKTLSNAVGRLAGVAVIFVILFCSFGMAAYLWYGRSIDGFETYWHTLTSLIGMLHGRFSFWTLMDHDRVYTHFFLYAYYIFCYGITIALTLAVLLDSYKTIKGQKYYKANMEMQDHEMVEFIMKRFKLWAGIDKPKQGSRRVHFDRRMFSATSRDSRPSSRDSNLSYDPFETNPRTTRNAADRLETTWEDCLCTLERVCGLDEKEDDIIKTTQKNIDEWNFQTRIKNYEKELQNPSDSKPPKGAPSSTQAARLSKIPRRTSTTGSEAGYSKRGLGTPDTRTVSMKNRPLSDQGGRVQPQPKPAGSKERFSIYNFFKSVNPSKDAWK